MVDFLSFRVMRYMISIILLYSFHAIYDTLNMANIISEFFLLSLLFFKFVIIGSLSIVSMLIFFYLLIYIPSIKKYN